MYIQFLKYFELQHQQKELFQFFPDFLSQIFKPGNNFLLHSTVAESCENGPQKYPTGHCIVCTRNFARPGGSNHNINGHKGQICQKIVKMDHRKTHTANAQEILPGPAEALTISVGCSEFDLYQAPLTKDVASKISLIVSNITDRFKQINLTVQ